MTSEPGPHCWAARSDNPNEIDLYVNYVPAQNEVNSFPITGVTLSTGLTEADSLTGEKVFLQQQQFVINRSSETQEAASITVKFGGRRCVARLTKLKVKDETPQAPCVNLNAQRECTECNFDVAVSKTFDKKAWGQSANYQCKNMPKNDNVAIRLSGAFSIDGSGPPHSYSLVLGISNCNGQQFTPTEANQTSNTGSGFVSRFDKSFEGAGPTSGTCGVELTYVDEPTSEPNARNGRTVSAQGGTKISITVK